MNVYVLESLNQFQVGDVSIVLLTRIPYTVMIVIKTRKICIKIILCIFYILQEVCAIVEIQALLNYFVQSIPDLFRIQNKLKNSLKNHFQKMRLRI